MIEGRKNDSDKAQMYLIPRIAQVEEARVLMFGAQKYDPWNWTNGMKWSRLLSAALRHITAYCDGENVDEESGLSHLAHARCCLGFLLDYEKSHPEFDDRRPRGDSTNLPDVLLNALRPELQTEVSQLSLFPELQ